MELFNEHNFDALIQDLQNFNLWKPSMAFAQNEESGHYQLQNRTMRMMLLLFVNR